MLEVVDELARAVGVLDLGARGRTDVSADVDDEDLVGKIDLRAVQRCEMVT